MSVREPDMVTAFGNYIWFLEPEKCIIDTQDIRVAVKNICRYNGALEWKLVQHLALCGKLAEINHNSTFLTGYCVAHDFHEIYCTDVVNGLKQHLNLYNKLEDMWYERVHNAIGLRTADISEESKSLIRQVDLTALCVEMEQLGHPHARETASRYGITLSDSEREAFQEVVSFSLEECWEYVWKSVVKARPNAYIHINTNE